MIAKPIEVLKGRSTIRLFDLSFATVAMEVPQQCHIQAAHIKG
jgi:hypothetical protein